LQDTRPSVGIRGPRRAGKCSRHLGRGTSSGSRSDGNATLTQPTSMQKCALLAPRTTSRRWRTRPSGAPVLIAEVVRQAKSRALAAAVRRPEIRQSRECGRRRAYASPSSARRRVRPAIGDRCVSAMVRSGGLSLLTNTPNDPCGPAQTSQPAHRPDHPTPHQPPSQLRRIQRVDHPIRRSGLSWKFKSLCSVIAARPAAGDTGER
jgi:hypothetical protein